jgi:hypothetical protein
MYIALRVKFRLFLPDFKETWIISTDCGEKIIRYEILWKSFLWGQSCSIRTDRHNAVNTWQSLWRCVYLQSLWRCMYLQSLWRCVYLQSLWRCVYLQSLWCCVYLQSLWRCVYLQSLWCCVYLQIFPNGPAVRRRCVIWLIARSVGRVNLQLALYNNTPPPTNSLPSNPPNSLRCCRRKCKPSTFWNDDWFNPLKTKRKPLYLKTQSVPRCKHFSSRL